MVARRAALFLSLFAILAAARAGDEEAPELPVLEHERLLVVAAHPDDETLATGGLIQRVLANHGTVRLVTLTAGDGYREALLHRSGELHPRPDEYKAYGERRIDELQDAVKALGRRGIQLSVLGFPDGDLAALLHQNWPRDTPARSPTTGEISPPYAEAADRRVKYDGNDLRAELLRIVKSTNPTLVVFPDPSDKHPDHATAGIFTLLALNDWADETKKRPSELPRMLSNIVHWPNWPPMPPAGTTPDEAQMLPLELPGNLPPPPRPVVELTLTPEEVGRKVAALQEHQTQQEAMGSFLERFERRTEPFRVFGPSDLDSVEVLVDALRERTVATPKDRTVH